MKWRYSVFNYDLKSLWLLSLLVALWWGQIWFFCINRFWPLEQTSFEQFIHLQQGVSAAATRNTVLRKIRKQTEIEMKVFVVLSVLALAAAKPQGYSYNQPSFGGSSLSGASSNSFGQSGSSNGFSGGLSLGSSLNSLSSGGNFGTSGKFKTLCNHLFEKIAF